MQVTLLERLRTLRDDGPEFCHVGICGNIGTVSGGEQEQLAELFRSWPKFSGNVAYPVPGVDRMTPSEAFFYIRDVWVGEYGALRSELLDHCIAELEAQFPETPTDEELRAKLRDGATYRVTGSTRVDHCFDMGDEVVLERDDGSTSPDFRRVRDGHCQYVHLSDLEVLEGARRSCFRGPWLPSPGSPCLRRSAGLWWPSCGHAGTGGHTDAPV